MPDFAHKNENKVNPMAGITLPLIQPPEMGWRNLTSVVTALVKLALILGAILTFFQVILGGLKWIVSGGDAKKTEEAGKQITNALVGLGIMAAAWASMLILEKFFNITILSGPIIITLPR